MSTRRILSVCFPDVIVTGAELPKGVLGLTRIAGGTTSILYQRDLEPPEHRIVIAHEIGHLVTDLVGVRRGERRCKAAGPGRRAVFEHLPEHELACDIFAGELVAPLAWLHEEVPEGVPHTDATNPTDAERTAQRIAWDNFVDNLASRYHVTKAVTRWRLAQLELARAGLPALDGVLVTNAPRRRRRRAG